MRRSLLLAAMTLAALSFSGTAASADELAVYRATTADAGLFDQYDNDGYSLAVGPGTGGALELRVRVSGQPLASRAPFPTGMPREPGLAASPDRDAFAQTLASGART